MIRTTKINKWGDSLGVRFPSEFAKAVSLQEKEYVEMRIKGEEIIIRRAPILPTLEELIANCPDWDGNPPESYDWGEAQGREIV